MPLVIPPTTGEDLVLVARIIDGDTIEVYHLIRDTIRLHGIDAPERHGPDREGAARAAARLAELTPPGQLARARFLGRDKYGRTLAQVGATDGRNAGEVLVSEGLAIAWGRQP